MGCPPHPEQAGTPSGRLASERLERVQLGLLGATVASCFVSIFASQTLLALGAIVFLVRLWLGQARLPRLPLDGAVVVFSVWTLLSASFSPDPSASFGEAKKLVLFLALYLAAGCLARRDHRERFLELALLGSLALALGALLQYWLLGYDDLGNRPRGLLGHYMTASGLCMGGMLLAGARLIFGPRTPTRPTPADLWAAGGLAAAIGLLTFLQRTGVFATEAERLFVAALAALAAYMALSRGAWPGPATGRALALLAFPLTLAALVASQTRNAWVGSLAGLAVLAVLWTPRSLWLLAAAVGALLLARPPAIVNRLTITDASSRDRYYMWQAGFDMIRDKPVFGQGPGMILGVYPRFRWPEAPNPRAPHLHDNALQIAAERGVPCLVFWLWWIAVLMADAYREARPGVAAREWGPAAALAVLTAVMVAGLFEYNLGDSEILMFVLLIAALPYAQRSERSLPPELGPQPAPLAR